MEKYLINGGRKISGQVKLEGAKNSVLPIIAGAILTNEQVIIEDCPKLIDVMNMLEILCHLGGKYKFEDGNLIIDASAINRCDIPCELTSKLRGSSYYIGALLSRLKRVKLGCTGGCNIGERPVDIHIASLEKLGAIFNQENEYLSAYYKEQKPNEIWLNYPSVGATENLLLASVFIQGKTKIKNCAKEPEVVDLMNFLNSMGANIRGAGSNEIIIEGVKKLHGTTYKPIKDRIEAGTFLISACITGGEIEIKGCKSENILPLLDKFLNNTCKVYIKDDIIYTKSTARIKSFSFTTGPYPQFPTDMQAQTMSLLAIANGNSVITEKVFTARFNQVPELIKMGAKISVHNNTAIVKGVPELHGAKLYAQDLRGGASLVLSALCAKGQSVVYGVEHIERGYSGFDEKLRLLGAELKKIKE